MSAYHNIIKKYEYNVNNIFKKLSYPQSLYESEDYYKEPNKNLIYDEAEPWAKANIENLFNDVWDWANNFCENASSRRTLQHALNSFSVALYDMRCIPCGTDKQRLDHLKSQLVVIASIVRSKVPDDITNRLSSLFWSV